MLRRFAYGIHGLDGAERSHRIDAEIEPSATRSAGILHPPAR